MCEVNYDKAHIESLLVDSLQSMVSGQVLQDVQCTKCNMVRVLTCIKRFHYFYNLNEYSRDLCENNMM